MIGTLRLTLALALLLTHALYAQTAGVHRMRAKECEARYQYPAAISEFLQAYALDKATDPRQTVVDLIGLGRAYLSTRQYPKALDAFRQALPKAKDTKDRQSQAVALTDMGVSYDDMNQTWTALSYYRQALPVWRQARSAHGESLALCDIGSEYNSLGQPAKALDYELSALSLDRRLQDRKGEMLVLSNLAIVYQGMGRFAQALAVYRQALPLSCQVGDEDREAIILSGIGYEYGELSRYQEALLYEGRALPILQRLGDQDQMASTRTGIGAVLDLLGQYPQALAQDQQALTLTRQAKDLPGEALVLTNIGAVYDDERQYEEALAHYRQALPIRKQLGDLSGEAGTLNNIAVALDDLHRYSEALSYYQRSLPLWRRIDDRADEATTLNDIGALYYDQTRYPEAEASYRRALAVRQEMGIPSINLQVSTLGNLMQVWGAAQNPRKNTRLAIFYGKRAVNACQAIRGNLQTLDQKARQAFLASFSYVYRDLADLLIGQGRLPEAQQVLRMLKEQEFYDFLNPSQGHAAPPALMDTIAPTPHEKTWERRYNDAATSVTIFGRRAQDLGDLAAPHPALTPQETAGGAALQAAHDRVTAVETQMAADFRRPPTAADALPDTAQADELAAALTPGTVAVYTIVAPDRLYLIILAPGRPAQARHTDITVDALYQKVRAFRWALADPDTDPRPRAAELYRLLFGPIQKDLDDAHAATVLFSLDDALRYLPLAALYDDHAHQYVVQRYATAEITLAAAAPPQPRTPPGPSVLGAGVSLSLDGLPPLPGVREEIDAIVRQTGDPADQPQGLLPGTRLLDPAFTRPALLARLGTGTFPYVHLASHFALHPTDADSFLLLGDGTRLSVAELASDPRRFRGVSLLALSACDTDMEVRSSTGREVEGLGALAQRLGARSVLASLWPVSDAATPVLMAGFYGLMRSHPGWPLPRVLQQCQLQMLTGTAGAPDPGDASGRGARRGTEMDDPPSGLTRAPFVPPAGAPYAHPYYWAPFVLIGNWK